MGLVPGPSEANGLVGERAVPHGDGLAHRPGEHFQRGLLVGEDKLILDHFPVQIKCFS